MRLFIIALLFAISYAQTDGFCVEWSECQPVYCNPSAPEMQYCPCTCNPGTINSSPDQWTATFGNSNSVTLDSGSGDSTGTDANANTNVDTGAGAGGVQPAQPAQPDLSGLSWTIMRPGYICEEQDFELMHFHLGIMRDVRQCAEAVARSGVCSPVFFTGLRSANCGCVRQGFECAENEANDLQADTTIYIMGGMPAATGAGAGFGGAPAGLEGNWVPSNGGMNAGMASSHFFDHFMDEYNMPGFYQNYGYGYSWKRSADGWHKAFKAPEDVKKEKENVAENVESVSPKSGKKSSSEPTLRKRSIMMHPDFEAPEAEDYFPGFMSMMGAGGAPFLSKSKQAEAATVSESKKPTSNYVFLALCVIFPAFVGFLAGMAYFGCKSKTSRQNLDVYSSA